MMESTRTSGTRWTRSRPVAGIPPMSPVRNLRPLRLLLTTGASKTGLASRKFPPPSCHHPVAGRGSNSRAGLPRRELPLARAEEVVAGVGVEEAVVEGEVARVVAAQEGVLVEAVGEAAEEVGLH